MYKQMVALSSLVGGTAAAALAMYLQYNPLAFTNPHVELETRIHAAVDRPAHLVSQVTTQAPPSSASATTATEASAANGTTDAASSPTFQDMDILELPPVLVKAPRRVVWRARPPLQSVAPASELNFSAPTEQNMTPDTPRSLRPCSDFRELGPANVDEGVPSGSVGVRDLC